MGHKTKQQTLVHLTTTQMRRMPKPRTGFEPFVQRLAALVDGNETVRALSDVDTSAMLEELAEYESTHTAVATARVELAMVEQTEFLHASNVWTQMLKIYRYARTLATDDPQLGELIADFEAFMRKPRKKVAAPAPAAA